MKKLILLLLLIIISLFLHGEGRYTMEEMNPSQIVTGPDAGKFIIQKI